MILDSTHSSAILDGLDATVKILAYLGAASFFIYKAVTGYFIVNLSLSASCERKRTSNANLDNILLNVTLNKGDRSSLVLYDMKAKVSYARIEEILTFSGINRLSFNEEKSSEVVKRTIEFNRLSKFPFLRLSAGEQTSFALLIENVPTDQICRVDVAVLAKKNSIVKRLRRLRYGVGQWRTSIISFPL